VLPSVSRSTTAQRRRPFPGPTPATWLQGTWRRRKGRVRQVIPAAVMSVSGLVQVISAPSPHTAAAAICGVLRETLAAAAQMIATTVDAQRCHGW
jgi:hypothetical protein